MVPLDPMSALVSAILATASGAVTTVSSDVADITVSSAIYDVSAVVNFSSHLPVDLSHLSYVSLVAVATPSLVSAFT